MGLDSSQSTETRRQGRKRLLLDAAVEVFSEKGYHAASVADILERAGVARGTFYRYFESKKDCFGAALDDFMERLRSPISQLDMSQPIGEKEMMLLYRDVAGLLIANPRDRQFARILLVEGVAADPVFATRLNTFYEDLTRMAAKFIETAIKAGRARQLDPEVTARCILGMVKEILIVWALQDKPQQDLFKMLMTTIEFGFYGLLPR